MCGRSWSVGMSELCEHLRMGDRRRGDTAIAHPVDRMLTLWTTPPADDSAVDRFRAVCADPYRVNGTPIAVEEIVERVRRIHAALAELHQVTVDRVDDGTRTALLLSHSGVHVGPLPTPLGTIARLAST
jgi:hypothetical protein